MLERSKWATARHKKVANDAKRGKLFTRLIKNIEVAARTDGGDPASNPTLFDAIQKARRDSVPADNIDRAVRRGSGDGADAADYESVIYEGHASDGVAVLIECLTDNRNRAASEVRVALTHNGGQLADPGSIVYMFARKGVVGVPSEGMSGDGALMAVLEAGVGEVEDEGKLFSVYCEPGDVIAVRSALQDAGIEYNSAKVQFIPSVKVEVDAEGARKALKVIDALEDCDDVQNVFSNLDVPEAVMTELEAEG